MKYITPTYERKELETSDVITASIIEKSDSEADFVVDMSDLIGGNR